MSKVNLKFLYQIPDGYVLARVPLREIKKTYPKAELIRTFHSLDSAREYCQKLDGVIDLIKTRDKWDAATRQKLREAKLGARNPNSKGLSDEHKRKIGKANKGRYKGANHPHWGTRRPRATRIKISQTKKAQRLCKRWAIRADGSETLVPCDFALPPGWSWGRRRGSTGKLKLKP